MAIIGKYGYIFYGLTRMLMSKNVNNDVTMNLPIGSRPLPPVKNPEMGRLYTGF